MNASLLDTIERRLPVILLLVSCLVYLMTLAPTISHTDSGELAAVFYTGGVAHPTGYPVFTLLGWLWTRIPLLDVALQLNLLCMLLVGGGVYFFARTLQEVFSDWNTRIKGEADHGKERVRTSHLLATAVGSLGLAFSPAYWMQSTSVEVYSLHILIVSLVLFFLVRAWRQPAEQGRNWWGLSIALAIGFGNHLSIFVVLPAIAWLFFRKMGFGKAAWVRLGTMLLIFFPLLTLFYAWLPLAASSDPLYNWGDPDSWENFWHHVSGKQFRVWMFTGAEDFTTDLKAFLLRIPGEFLYVGAVLALLGAWYGWKLRRDLVIALLAMVLVNVLYAANYHIKDIEPYYLPTHFALAFFMALGIRYLWVRASLPAHFRMPLALVLAGYLLTTVVLHWPKVSQRGAWQYEDYARQALLSLPENAIVVSRNWDVFVSPAYYLQAVEGVRPDVRIFEYQMMHDRHWYPEHIRRNFPDIAQRLDAQLKEWDEAVGNFDLRDNPNSVRLSRGFMALFYGLLEEALEGPVYLGPEMFPGTMQRDQLPMPDQVTLVPERFFMRMIPASNVAQYYPIPEQSGKIRFGRGEEEGETTLLRNAWTDVLVQRAVYELVFGKRQEAAELVRQVREVLPNRPLPSSLAGL